MDLREIIKGELARRDWSGYKLGQVSGVPIRTVQRYLSGGIDLAGRRLAAILEALDLEVVPRRRGRKGGR